MFIVWDRLEKSIKLPIFHLSFTLQYLHPKKKMKNDRYNTIDVASFLGRYLHFFSVQLILESN